MSHLRTLDRALILILVPIWVACFALSVRSVVRGDGRPGLGVSAPADAESYPTVNGQIYYMTRPSYEASGLRRGDRLIRMGEVDLRGVHPFHFVALSSEQAAGGERVSLVIERGAERSETFLPMAPFSHQAGQVAGALVCLVVGVIVLLRAPRDPLVRAFFYAMLVSAFSLLYLGGGRVEHYLFTTTSVGGTSLMFALLLRFSQRFPRGDPPRSWWSRFLPWVFVLHGFFNLLVRTGQMTGVGGWGTQVMILAGAVACAVALTRNYRRGDVVERRQIKWILLAAFCIALAVTFAGILSTVDSQRLGWLVPYSYALTGLVPIAVLVSVGRYNLFDVDRLLSAAASYNVVLVVLGAGVLVAVPRAAEAVSGLLGIDPGTSQLAHSLGLAAVLVPAQRRLRPQVERLFFKDRYALDRGIAELLPTLSQCPDAAVLTERVGEGLHRLLRPESCVGYAGIDETYVPIFVEGRAVPPSFGAASPLIGALTGRRTPLALGKAGRRPDEAPLGPFDRAALETLGAEVIVPVHRQEALSAFLCLGPKRSGDVYTATDLSLLTAVAETVSRELRRFDQEELIREGREMQESLQRYVPSAVADQLASGSELASGEREVSVMFVDIRGYTSFSESRRAEEIFSTVNRYTETVSQIVQKHAGSVVEFNGDGMMAVFGAPRELARKERAAVEAGREIVEAVGSMPVDDAQAGQTHLSVGVGIATGDAFVGNIQAVDRMIWSAIGNTTNLAARLQSLTRDLDASLVIDAGTWERAEAAAAGFGKRPDVPIRGRRETQDLYALPMRSNS